MRRCAMVALSAVLSFGCISQEEQQPDDRLVGTKWEARDYPYEEKTGVAPAYNIYEFICPRQVEQYVVQDGHVVEAIGTYAYELAYPRLTFTRRRTTSSLSSAIRGAWCGWRGLPRMPITNISGNSPSGASQRFR